MTPPIVSYPFELPSLFPEQRPLRLAVALGVFDGVHRGHQAILAALKEMASQQGALPVALFFTPHPKTVLHLGNPEELTTLAVREELLLSYGAQALIAMPFTRELAALSPEEFLMKNFSGGCGVNVTGFCVGENWRFGRKNEGDSQLLRQLAMEKLGAETRIVPSLQEGNTVISSTQIRQAVLAGNLERAEKMLGRSFSVEGTVRHGWRNGHNVTQIPTANLTEEDCPLLPPDGVYAACASWVTPGGIRQNGNGLVYVGEAPTIRKEVHQRTVELHLFSAPEKELYDSQIKITFSRYLRGSCFFSTVEALQQQIQRDIQQAREIFQEQERKMVWGIANEGKKGRN